MKRRLVNEEKLEKIWKYSMVWWSLTIVSEFRLAKELLGLGNHKAKTWILFEKIYTQWCGKQQLRAGDFGPLWITWEVNCKGWSKLFKFYLGGSDGCGYSSLESLTWLNHNWISSQVLTLNRLMTTIAYHKLVHELKSWGAVKATLYCKWLPEYLGLTMVQGNISENENFCFS